LKSITIHDGVIFIGGLAFNECKSIYVKGDVEKVKDVISEFNPECVQYVKPLSSINEN
jgi:hypothetical protein